MHVRISLALLLAGAAATAGCRDSVASPAAPPTGPFDLVVETDKPQYSLTTDSVARILLTNRSAAAVYLPMAEFVVYERLRDGEWRDAYAWFVVDGTVPSFPVNPGKPVTNELQLWFYLRDRPGTYRVRYFVYADAGLEWPLPIEERVSPAFVVVP